MIMIDSNKAYKSLIKVDNGTFNVTRKVLNICTKVWRMPFNSEKGFKFSLQQHNSKFLKVYWKDIQLIHALENLSNIPYNIWYTRVYYLPYVLRRS